MSHPTNGTLLDAMPCLQSTDPTVYSQVDNRTSQRQIHYLCTILSDRKYTSGHRRPSFEPVTTVRSRPHAYFQLKGFLGTIEGTLQIRNAHKLTLCYFYNHILTILLHLCFRRFCHSHTASREACFIGLPTNLVASQFSPAGFTHSLLARQDFHLLR